MTPDFRVTEEDFSDEEADDSADSDGFVHVPLAGSKNQSPEKIQQAAQKQQKRDEMKRLRVAQEIQRQLQEVCWRP